MVYAADRQLMRLEQVDRIQGVSVRYALHGQDRHAGQDKRKAVQCVRM